MIVMSILFPENYPFIFSLLLGSSKAAPGWLHPGWGTGDLPPRDMGRHGDPSAEAGPHAALVTTATLYQPLLQYTGL